MTESNSIIYHFTACADSVYLVMAVNSHVVLRSSSYIFFYVGYNFLLKVATMADTFFVSWESLIRG